MELDHFIENLRVNPLFENIRLELPRSLSVAEGNRISRSDISSIVQATAGSITSVANLAERRVQGSAGVRSNGSDNSAGWIHGTNGEQAHSSNQ